MYFVGWGWSLENTGLPKTREPFVTVSIRTSLLLHLHKQLPWTGNSSDDSTFAMESNASWLEVEPDNSKGNLVVWSGRGSIDGIDTNTVSDVTAQIEPSSPLFLHRWSRSGFWKCPSDIGSGFWRCSKSGTGSLFFKSTISSGACTEQMFHRGGSRKWQHTRPHSRWFTTARGCLRPVPE